MSPLLREHSYGGQPMERLTALTKRMIDPVRGELEEEGTSVFVIVCTVKGEVGYGTHSRLSPEQEVAVLAGAAESTAIRHGIIEPES